MDEHNQNQTKKVSSRDSSNSGGGTARQWTSGNFEVIEVFEDEAQLNEWYSTQGGDWITEANRDTRTHHVTELLCRFSHKYSSRRMDNNSPYSCNARLRIRRPLSSDSGVDQSIIVEKSAVDHDHEPKEAGIGRLSDESIVPADEGRNDSRNSNGSSANSKDADLEGPSTSDSKNENSLEAESAVCKAPLSILSTSAASATENTEEVKDYIREKAGLGWDARKIQTAMMVSRMNAPTVSQIQELMGSLIQDAERDRMLKLIEAKQVSDQTVAKCTEKVTKIATEFCTEEEEGAEEQPKQLTKEDTLRNENEQVDKDEDGEEAEEEEEEDAQKLTIEDDEEEEDKDGEAEGTGKEGAEEREEEEMETNENKEEEKKENKIESAPPKSAAEVTKNVLRTKPFGQPRVRGLDRSQMPGTGTGMLIASRPKRNRTRRMFTPSPPPNERKRKKESTSSTALDAPKSAASTSSAPSLFPSSGIKWAVAPPNQSQSTTLVKPQQQQKPPPQSANAATIGSKETAKPETAPTTPIRFEKAPSNLIGSPRRSFTSSLFGGSGSSPFTQSQMVTRRVSAQSSGGYSNNAVVDQLLTRKSGDAMVQQENAQLRRRNQEQLLKIQAQQRQIQDLISANKELIWAFNESRKQHTELMDQLRQFGRNQQQQLGNGNAGHGALALAVQQATNTTTSAAAAVPMTKMAGTRTAAFVPGATRGGRGGRKKQQKQVSVGPNMAFVPTTTIGSQHQYQPRVPLPPMSLGSVLRKKNPAQTEAVTPHHQQNMSNGKFGSSQRQRSRNWSGDNKLTQSTNERLLDSVKREIGDSSCSLDASMVEGTLPAPHKAPPLSKEEEVEKIVGLLQSLPHDSEIHKYVGDRKPAFYTPKEFGDWHSVISSVVRKQYVLQIFHALCPELRRTSIGEYSQKYPSRADYLRNSLDFAYSTENELFVAAKSRVDYLQAVAEKIFTFCEAHKRNSSLGLSSGATPGDVRGRSSSANGANSTLAAHSRQQHQPSATPPPAKRTLAAVLKPKRLSLTPSTAVTAATADGEH